MLMLKMTLTTFSGKDNFAVANFKKGGITFF